MESPPPGGKPGGGPRHGRADAGRPSGSHTSRPVTSGGRFPAGHVIGERYRIVGLLGRGGMGEVYRADDLKLGESVALKFLPRSVAEDPEALAGFHHEVRISRQVTHPNVCRVYDIVEAEGEVFISMEFIDGEDLAQLIRRIGRLPQDKAVELAREMCSALAAAHEKGVLHRDLKPANIMIDGRGRVRVTDFGIAVLAASGDDRIAGTPAYMAPEQMAGSPATVASDLYSLGLVLYEVFTGKPAYAGRSLAEIRRQHESRSVPSPSTAFREIDPVVEKAILRCLETEPRDRPPSVLALAAALPGGDPLAAALAAGETPSPELLVEAGDKGGLRPRSAGGLLAAVLAMLWLITLEKDHLSLMHRLPEKLAPEVLEVRAREHLKYLGYASVFASEVRWFEASTRYVSFIARPQEGQDRAERARSAWQRYESTQPPSFTFQFRASPEPMAPLYQGGMVSSGDPPLVVPGMVRMQVDPIGRMASFQAVPPRQAPDTEPAAPSEPDFAAIFERAGLEMLAETPSVWTPSVQCDVRRAWTARYPEAPELDLTVEVGVTQGRVNRFEVFGPWDQDEGSAELEARPMRMFLWLFLMIIASTAALAVRNLRAGRGDRRGALRLGLYVFALTMVAWVLQADHQSGFPELYMFNLGFDDAVGFGAFCWLLYIAIEPYARRHMPHSLVSWTRVLKGRWRDPLVGRDVLLGVSLGICAVVASFLPHLLSTWGLATPNPDLGGGPRAFLGGRHAIAILFEAQLSIGLFLGIFILFLVVRLFLRRAWAAYGALFAVLVVAFAIQTDGSLGSFTFSLIAPVLILACMRFGLLTLTVFSYVGPLAWSCPTTFDTSVWYWDIGLIGPIFVVLLAVYGFWVALAGQPLFRDELDQ